MIHCNLCGLDSPDGSQCCVHCGQGSPPGTVITPVSQQPFVQPDYGHPYPTGGLFGEFKPTISSFMGFFLACCVPILNLVIFFKLCFGKSAPPAKQAYVRATAILGLVAIGLSILGAVLMSIAGAGLVGALTKIFDYGY